MANEQQKSDEKYEGPSKTIEVLGKGNAIGWIGSIGGLIVGGVIASFSTKDTSKRAKAITEWLKNMDIHISGKTAITIAGAIAGSQIGHWVSYVIGIGHGKKTSGKGQKQFERIKHERDAAKQELEAVKSELEVNHKAEEGAALEPHDSAADRKTSPTHHVHAGVVEAGKEVAAAEIAR